MAKMNRKRFKSAANKVIYYKINTKETLIGLEYVEKIRRLR